MCGATNVQAPWFLRLFLAPDDLGLGEAVQLLRQHILRERIELLDAQDLDAVLVALLALFHQVEIDLAGAQDHALDLLSSASLRGQAPGTTSAWSRSTRWNDEPGPKSARNEMQRLWRSSDFGVIRISGLRNGRCIWRRRTWK